MSVDIDSSTLKRIYRWEGYPELDHFQQAAGHQLILADEEIFVWLVRAFY